MVNSRNTIAERRLGVAERKYFKTFFGSLKNFNYLYIMIIINKLLIIDNKRIKVNRDRKSY